MKNKKIIVGIVSVVVITSILIGSLAVYVMHDVKQSPQNLFENTKWLSNKVQVEKDVVIIEDEPYEFSDKLFLDRDEIKGFLPSDYEIIPDYTSQPYKYGNNIISYANIIDEDGLYKTKITAIYDSNYKLKHLLNLTKCSNGGIGWKVNKFTLVIDCHRSEKIWVEGRGKLSASDIYIINLETLVVEKLENYNGLLYGVFLQYLTSDGIWFLSSNTIKKLNYKTGELIEFPNIEYNTYSADLNGNVLALIENNNNTKEVNISKYNIQNESFEKISGEAELGICHLRFISVDQKTYIQGYKRADNCIGIERVESNLRLYLFDNGKFIDVSNQYSDIYNKSFSNNIEDGFIIDDKKFYVEAFKINNKLNRRELVKENCSSIYSYFFNQDFEYNNIPISYIKKLDEKLLIPLKYSSCGSNTAENLELSLEAYANKEYVEMLKQNGYDSPIRNVQDFEVVQVDDKYIINIISESEDPYIIGFFKDFLELQVKVYTENFEIRLNGSKEKYDNFEKNGGDSQRAA